MNNYHLIRNNNIDDDDNFEKMKNEKLQNAKKVLRKI